MNQVTVDEILITRPSREDVLNLKVGDMAPDVFGKMNRVVRIYARGISAKGKAYVCFYAEFGTNGSMSGGLTEDEIVPTIPVISRWMRAESAPCPRA